MEFKIYEVRNAKGSIRKLAPTSNVAAMKKDANLLKVTLMGKLVLGIHVLWN